MHTCVHLLSVCVWLCVSPIAAEGPFLSHLGAAESESHVFWVCHSAVQPAARRRLRCLLRQRLRRQRDVSARSEHAAVPPAGPRGQGKCVQRAHVVDNQIVDCQMWKWLLGCVFACRLCRMWPQNRRTRMINTQWSCSCSSRVVFWPSKRRRSRRLKLRCL